MGHNLRFQRFSTSDQTASSNRSVNHRSQFDSSMYECLGHIIVVKVFSHQLNSELEIINPRKKPHPNMLVTSEDQIADNAATQAHKIYEN